MSSQCNAKTQFNISKDFMNDVNFHKALIIISQVSLGLLKAYSKIQLSRPNGYKTKAYNFSSYICLTENLTLICVLALL